MIKDQKELQALLKLCRKQGVTEITLEGISIKFGALPAKRAGESAADDDDDEIPTGELSLEELTFFSAPKADQ